MAKATKKKRQTSGSIRIDSNVRCLRIYPTEDTTKQVADLKTVGLKLSRDQAIHFARVLLAVTQEWDEVEVTAYRFDRRQSDGLYRLTVTTSNKSSSRGA